MSALDWIDESYWQRNKPKKEQMKAKIIRTVVGEENKKPGQRGPGWRLAKVSYIGEDGNEGTQSVMSFKNPAVFKAVQDLQGETVDVTLTKNGQYDEWAAVVKSSGATIAATGTAATAGTTRVTGSNYETPAERARRQVLIVRQSSVTAALKFYELLDDRERMSVESVKDLAQDFTNWVFQDELADAE